VVAEVLDDRHPHVHGTAAGDTARVGVGLNPALVDPSGIRLSVRAVERHDLAGIAVGFEEVLQVLLGPAGFGEDDSFPRGADLGHLFEADLQSLEQSSCLGVNPDASRPTDVAIQLLDLGVQLLAVERGRRRFWWLGGFLL